MDRFCMYAPKKKDVPQDITIVDLIPTGKENAISRKILVALCLEHGLIETNQKDNDRRMRDLINKARKKYVILNLSDGNGYYRPTLKEMMNLQRHIRQSESRIRELRENLEPEKALYEDYRHGRIEGE